MGASIPALVQHDVLGQNGDGSTVGVQRYSAVCGVGRVDYIHPRLGRFPGIQEGREEEVIDRRHRWSMSGAEEGRDQKEQVYGTSTQGYGEI